MMDKEKEKRILHESLKSRLISGYLDERLEDGNRLLAWKGRFKVYNEAPVAQLTSVSSDFEYLESKGLLSIGNYKPLKDIFEDVDQRALKLISETEQEIEEIDNTSKQSLATSDTDQRALGRKRKLEITVKSSCNGETLQEKIEECNKSICDIMQTTLTEMQPTTENMGQFFKSFEGLTFKDSEILEDDINHRLIDIELVVLRKAKILCSKQKGLSLDFLTDILKFLSDINKKYKTNIHNIHSGSVVFYLEFVCNKDLYYFIEDFSHAKRYIKDFVLNCYTTFGFDTESLEVYVLLNEVTEIFKGSTQIDKEREIETLTDEDTATKTRLTKTDKEYKECETLTAENKAIKTRSTQIDKDQGIEALTTENTALKTKVEELERMLLVADSNTRAILLDKLNKVNDHLECIKENDASAQYHREQIKLLFDSLKYYP